MLERLIQRVTLLLSFMAAAALLVGIFMMARPKEFWHTMGELHDGLANLFAAIGIGVEIVFFTGLLLVGAYALIRLRNMWTVQVIGPTRHGPQQAVMVRERGMTRVEHLANTQIPLDANQLMAALQKSMLANYQSVNTIVKQQRVIDQYGDYDEDEDGAPSALPPPEGIPEVVPYSAIRDQVPGELSLLGIHPHNGELEIISPDKLKTAWFVGGSNTGKTNTVYGKVGDVVEWGAKILINDSHAHKDDSLTKKLRDFHHRLLMTPAQKDEDIKRATIRFLQEFMARRDEGSSCDELWLIVTDEVNATGEHMVAVTPEEETWLKANFGLKIKEGRIKLMVLFKILAETCGYESRGFGMFGFFISQKAAGLSWLRNAMMTVFVHGLLMDSEALLAANNDRALAKLVRGFKKGRTLVYGYEIEQPLILQQPLYESVKTDHPDVMSRQQEQEEVHPFTSADYSADTIPLSPSPFQHIAPSGNRPDLRVVEGGLEGVEEGASKGDSEGIAEIVLSEREKRICEMFFTRRLNINKIASELSGQTGGTKYAQASIEVAEAIRKYAEWQQQQRGA